MINFTLVRVAISFVILLIAFSDAALAQARRVTTCQSGELAIARLRIFTELLRHFSIDLRQADWRLRWSAAPELSHPQKSSTSCRKSLRSSWPRSPAPN